MAPIEKKRRRDLPSLKAKKRQRTDLGLDGTQEILKGEAVGLNKLAWNQVAVDRLEDAEGFFGLEELSDVEVVRDPILGRVEYKVRKRSLQISFRGVITAQCSFYTINLQPENLESERLQLAL